MSARNFEQRFSQTGGGTVGSHQSEAAYSQFKDEVKHKKQLLQQIKSSQKNISIFEQELIERHQLISQTRDDDADKFSNFEKANRLNTDINMRSNSTKGAQFPQESSPNGPSLSDQRANQVPSSYLRQRQSHQIAENNPMLHFAAQGPIMKHSLSHQSLDIGTEENQYQANIDSRTNSYRGLVQVPSNTVLNGGQPVHIQYERPPPQMQTIQNHEPPHIAERRDSRYSLHGRINTIATENEDRIRRGPRGRNSIHTQHTHSSYADRSRSRSNKSNGLSPLRQFEMPLPKDSTLSSNQNFRGSNQQQLSNERQTQLINLVSATNSREQSVSPKRVSHQLSARTLSNQAGTGGASLNSKHSIQGSQNSNYQRKQENPFNRNMKFEINRAGQETIEEQDLSQEISSIMNTLADHPERPKATVAHQNVSQDDSQYVLTSVQNSQSLSDNKVRQETLSNNQFVFNQKALESTKNVDQMINSQANFGEKDIENDGSFSEPCIKSQKKIYAEENAHPVGVQARANFNPMHGTYLETAESYRTRKEVSNQGKYQGNNHHAGGSFGNLEDFSNQLQNQERKAEMAYMQIQSVSDLDNPNIQHILVPQKDDLSSFVRIEKMLQSKSPRISNGDFHSNQPEKENKAAVNQYPRMVSYRSKSALHSSGGDNEKPPKVRILVQRSTDKNNSVHSRNGKADQNNSSIEFRRRKYQIHKRSSSGTGDDRGKRSKSRKRSDSAKNIVEYYSNRKNRSKSRRSSTLRKSKYSSSHERGNLNPSGKYRRNKKLSKSAKLSSETDSRSRSESSQSNAILSIEHKSRGSYGKYFVRSRSRLRRQDTSPNEDSRKISKKRRRRGHSASAKTNRKRNPSRSKSEKRRRSSAKRNRRINRSSLSLKSRSKSRGRKQQKSNKSLDAYLIDKQGSLSQKRHKKKSKQDLNRSKSLKKEKKYLAKQIQNMSKLLYNQQKRSNSVMAKTANIRNRYKSGGNGSFERATIGYANQLQNGTKMRQNPTRPPKQQQHIYRLQSAQQSHCPNMNTIQPLSNQLVTLECCNNKRNNSRTMRTVQTQGSHHKSQSKHSAKRSHSKNRRQEKDQTADSIVLNPQSGETLAQRLLMDLAKKYKNMQQNEKSFRYNFGSGTTQQKSQQSQMIQEIQSLATALITSEKRMVKIRQEKEIQTRKLKNIIKEQEECMLLMQQKIQRVEAKNEKLLRNDERLLFEKQKEDQKLAYEYNHFEEQFRIAEKKLIDNRNKFDKEKKDIIIGMERELQTQQQKLTKKSDIKIKSLQQITDQLNVKLQHLEQVEQNFDALQNEYNQSLQIINEQQEQIAIDNDYNQQLRQSISDLQLQLDHTAARSTEKISELKSKMDKQQNKFDNKILQMQKDHNCEIQKGKISQGHVEDGQKYEFEEQIIKLQMTLKAKEDKLDEAVNKIDSMKRQNTLERQQSSQNNAELLKQYQQSEEERESVEHKVRDLQQHIQNLEKMADQKDDEIAYLGKKNVELENNRNDLTERSETEQREQIKQLQNQLIKQKRETQDTMALLQQEQEHKRIIQQESQSKMVNFQIQNDLQKQEIHILAQGFQAQQQKLYNSQPQRTPFTQNPAQGSFDSVRQTANFKGISELRNGSPIKIETSSTRQDPADEHLHYKTDQSIASARPESQVQVRRQAHDSENPNSDIQEVSSTVREHLINHQNMNIVSTYDANQDDEESESQVQNISSDEENLYFQNENYQKNRQKVLAKAAIVRQSQNSLSSTDRKLDNLSPGVLSNKMKQLQRIQMEQEALSSKQRNMLIHDMYKEESVSLSSADSQNTKRQIKTQLTQKNEEIQILLNVINQINLNKQQSSDQDLQQQNIPAHIMETFNNVQMAQDNQNDGDPINFLDVAQLTTNLSSGEFDMSRRPKTNHVGLNSGGNQSSIMGINAAFQNQPNFQGIGQEFKDLQHTMFSDYASTSNPGLRQTSSNRNAEVQNTIETTSKYIEHNFNEFSSNDYNTNQFNLRDSNNYVLKSNESIDSQRPDQRLTQSRDSNNSVAQQELIDVKKRIKMLMGGKSVGGTSRLENTDDQMKARRQVKRNNVTQSNTHSRTQNTDQMNSQHSGVEASSAQYIDSGVESGRR